MQGLGPDLVTHLHHATPINDPYNVAKCNKAPFNVTYGFREKHWSMTDRTGNSWRGVVNPIIKSRRPQVVEVYLS